MTSKFSIDNRELLQRISSGEAVVGIHFGNLIVRELAAFRLAAMDSEPVAEVLSNRPGNDTSTIDRAMPVGTQLYPQVQPVLVVPDELLKEYLRLVDCMLSDYRNGNYGDAQSWIRHIAKASDVFAEKHGLSPWEMSKKTFANHPAHCVCVNCVKARRKWDYV